MQTNFHRKERPTQLREWAPLSDVLDHLPSHYYRGLLPLELSITCIAALEDYLALGTNVGLVFWYNRSNGHMQRYKTEGMKRLTCLKLIDSVEYMLAAGNCEGQVNVFRIFKDLNSNLSATSSSRPVERYIIRDLHRSAISCCEWSKNGLRLYSGDRQGVVVLTDFDYDNHLSKSMEILNEHYEIVQMSSYPGYLLVCSLCRTVVCRRYPENNGRWQTTLIGNREREELTDGGGILLPNVLGSVGGKPELLCVDETSCGFYMADVNTGQIQKTFQFPVNIIKSKYIWEIPILNPKKILRNDMKPSSSSSSSSSASMSFSSSIKFQNIYRYHGINQQQSFDSDNSMNSDDNKSNALSLVTHDNNNLYILNMESQILLSAIARGFRRILDISLCNREIFILEGPRSIIRLAPMPEKTNRTANIIYNPLLPPPIPLMGNHSNGLLDDCYREPLKEDIITVEEPTTPLDVHHDVDNDVIKAEECFELPPIEPINLSVPIVLATETHAGHILEQRERYNRFQEISQMDFDDNILHHSSLNTSIGMSNNIPLETRVPKESKEKETTANQSKLLGIVEIGRMAHVNDASNHNNSHIISTSVPFRKIHKQDEQKDHCWNHENRSDIPMFLSDTREQSSSKVVKNASRENSKSNRLLKIERTPFGIKDDIVETKINLQSIYSDFTHDLVNTIMENEEAEEEEEEECDYSITIINNAPKISNKDKHQNASTLSTGNKRSDNLKDSSSSSEWEFLDNGENL